MQHILDHLKANQDAALSELCDFLRIPSISADSKYAGDMRKCADWVKASMEDAGLKAQSVDSGLPVIFGRTDVKYVKCSDEHGVVEDMGHALKVGDKLKLVPGHCDPTCNVHDWYVGVRDGRVEVVWPVTARGKAY